MSKEFKGVWIPREVWLNSNLKVMEKIFLVEIASLDGINGCYASNSYFSDFFDLSKTRCSAIIKTLQEKGYITIRRFYEEGKKSLERRIIKVNKEMIKANCDRTLMGKIKGTKPKESEANVEFINREVDELIDINQSNEELKEIECNKDLELGEEIKELDTSLETSQDNKKLGIITYNEIYEVRVEGVTKNLINYEYFLRWIKLFKYAKLGIILNKYSICKYRLE
ncbi:MAG: helix-turn-helix domain-containing protein [Clostridia bacterium]